MILSESLTQLAELLVQTIGSLGYLGIIILMAIESSFLPIVPSELVLIPAGVLASRGEMSIFLIIICGAVGSLVGALFNYTLAFYLGRKAFNALASRYNIPFINQKSLLKSEEYFDKHGEITTFIGRLIIAVRHFISIPAGFSRMNLAKFSVYTFLGSAIWSAILVVLGFMLGENELIIKQNLHSIVTWMVIACLLIIFIYYLYIKKRKIN